MTRFIPLCHIAEASYFVWPMMLILRVLYMSCATYVAYSIATMPSCQAVVPFQDCFGIYASYTLLVL